MLQIIVWALLNGCALADYCSLNADSTACAATNQSQCTNVCDLYESQAGCISVSGCRWSSGGYCSKNSSDTCYSYYAEGDCTNATDSTCVWQTLPCKFRYSCESSSFSTSCNYSTSAAQCTSQSGCAWTPQCDASTTCEMQSSQTDCTGNSGCFWFSQTSSQPGPSSGCSSCFADISNTSNNYLAAKRDLNQECTADFFAPSITITSAVPASSGCMGGIATPRGPYAECGTQSSYCSLNADNNACSNPTQSRCINACRLYQSQAGCMSVSGCNWTVTNFFGAIGGTCSTTNSSNYCSGGTESDCTADGTNPACVWQTLPCKFSFSCSVSSTSGSCMSAGSAAQCTSQSGCAWTPQCDASTTCEMQSSQTDCTGTSGCFWSSGTSSQEGAASGCSSCFTDISNTTSDYLAAKRDLNKKCSVSFFFLTTSYTITNVVPASTGCVGGTATPPTMTCGAGAASVMSAIAVTLGSAFILF